MEGGSSSSGVVHGSGLYPGLNGIIVGEAKRLFVDNGILSARELKARFEIKNEIYLKNCK